MKLKKTEERALALAGLVQSCYLVAGIARTGMASQDNLAGCLESIFVTNPDETLDVYKGGNGVRTGLRLVSEILGELKIGEHGETIRYVMDVLSLEQRLRRTPKLMRSLGAGISAIQEHRHLNELTVTDEDIILRLSRLYEETAGTAQPRIRIQGQQKHLGNTMNTSRIRALLLAAIRSAVLWHQLDGRRSQWLLGRGKLLRAVDRVSEIVS
ncbi:MAG: high frequency lysogenization protein HflD [Gammaproteobacteria bacterium]|jgi:high frequency lysogenization protein|nr:high frequency lysogenization protein HflD [Gammaproteobacteria bacterium]